MNTNLVFPERYGPITKSTMGFGAALEAFLYLAPIPKISCMTTMTNVTNHSSWNDNNIFGFSTWMTFWIR